MRLADAVEAAWSVLRAPDVDIGAGPWLESMPDGTEVGRFEREALLPLA